MTRIVQVTTMLNKNNDDSTSSEDEISKNALKEATNHQFFKDTYLSTTKSVNLEISEETNKHSKYYNLTFIYFRHVELQTIVFFSLFCLVQNCKITIRI